MSFATREQVEQFYVSCPQFEQMLVQEGILLLKYWFSINDDEQENVSRNALITKSVAGS